MTFHNDAKYNNNSLNWIADDIQGTFTLSAAAVSETFYTLLIIEQTFVKH
jgi:hypothetical protein